MHYVIDPSSTASCSIGQDNAMIEAQKTFRVVIFINQSRCPGMVHIAECQIAIYREYIVQVQVLLLILAFHVILHG